MSLTLTLIPVAVAVGMSLSSSSIAALTSLRGKKTQSFDPVETTFADAALLLKTLGEHGLQVQQHGENEFVVQTESGTLRYFRTQAEAPFYLELSGVSDLDGLLDSLDSLENEYRRNVQAFTYDKVKSYLAEHGMTLEQESVMDDESILLTLSL